MSKNPGKTPTDKAYHVKNYAFWLWEYQRRNTEYIKDCCDIFAKYNGHLKSNPHIREKYFTDEYALNSLDILNKNPKDQERLYNEMVEKIISESGEETWSFLQEYFASSRELVLKYKRFPKPSFDGQGSDHILQVISSGNAYKFETEDQSDILSLIFRRKDWKIEVNKAYSAFGSSLLDKIELPLDASLNPTNLKIIADEYGAMSYARQFIMKFFGGEENKIRVLDSIYDLFLLNENNKITNEARVAGLWMRDKAFLENPKDVESGFSNAFKEYKKRIEKSTEGRWATYTRKNLALQVFRTTNECIEKIDVLKMFSDSTGKQ